jgi:hypothetical protein
MKSAYSIYSGKILIEIREGQFFFNRVVRALGRSRYCGFSNEWESFWITSRRWAWPEPSLSKGSAAHVRHWVGKCKHSRRVTATATIEESCILSAHMYIDTILLHTPLKVLLKSIANRQLQQAMMQSRSARDLEENKEILDWIAATAAIGVCINESEGRSCWQV